MDRKQFMPGGLKLDEAGQVTVAFAQLNVIDKDGDVTLPGAFPSGKAVPMSAYGHASWDGALPVGRGTIAEEGAWAIFRGQMFLNTSHGRDAYETLKGLGSLAEFSYGYNVVDSARGTFQGKGVRFLRKLDVFEVSSVLVGAGVGTALLAIKSGARASSPELAAIRDGNFRGMVEDNAAASLEDGRKALAELARRDVARRADPSTPEGAAALRAAARRAGVRV